jgi:hypothetical protein
MQFVGLIEPILMWAPAALSNWATAALSGAWMSVSGTYLLPREEAGDGDSDGDV